MPKGFLGHKAYRLLFGIGALLLLSGFFISVVFFKALHNAQLDSKKQILANQTRWVANEIETAFAHFDVESGNFLAFLETWGEKKNQKQGDPALEARKIFSAFPGLVDTLWVDFGDSAIFFTSSPEFGLVEGKFNDPILFHGTPSYVVEGKTDYSLVFDLEIEWFFRQVISTATPASGIGVGLLVNSKLVNAGNSTLEIVLKSTDFEQILSDAYLGQAGYYRVDWMEGEREVEGVIGQYPLKLGSLTDPVSVVTLAPEDYFQPAEYSTMVLSFVGLLFIFSVAVFLFAFYLKKKLRNAKKTEATFSELSVLFEQQNLLLRELRGFVFFHHSNLDIQRISDEAEHVLGCSKERLILEFNGNTNHPVAVRVKEELSKAVQEKKESVDLEYDFHRGDGRKIRIRIFEKLNFDEQGKFKGGMGICNDVTDQYHSRVGIVQSENRLRSLINNLPDIIFIYDNEGRVTDFHMQGKEQLLKAATTTLGKKLEEFIPASQLNEILSAFKTARKTGKIQTANATWEDEFDGVRHYEIRFFPLDQDQMISVSKDVTSQKIWENGLVEAMNAADLASKAKSEFLANMSHEIRTPMNGLLGIIDLLEGTDLNRVQRQYVDIIKNSGNALLTIIRDILDYSKIESGKIDIQNTLFNPVKEVEAQMDILRAIANKKNISLDFRYADQADRMLEGDKGKINQILLNLMGNAIKFTPEKGKVSIELEMEVFGEQQYFLHYHISDTGIGISEENVRYLSKPFYQVESSNTKSYQGAGLGLAIAKKVAELLGGELTFKSRLGEGSTFSFSVLVKRVNESAIREVQPVPSWKDIREIGAAFPLRILLAEDNDLNLQLMSMMFEQLGFEFEVAKNGQEVVEKVKDGSFDVVLMDVQMPIMNGLEATLKIRNLPDKKDLIIIGLSANVFEEDEKKALAYGMNDYLTKPIRLTVLADKLEYLSRKKRAKVGG